MRTFIFVVIMLSFFTSPGTSQTKTSLDYLFHKMEKEDTINRMQIDLRNEHVKRLNEGQCKVYDGMIFLDCVDYLEKICDHLANISQGLLGGFRWE